MRRIRMRRSGRIGPLVLLAAWAFGSGCELLSVTPWQETPADGVEHASELQGTTWRLAEARTPDGVVSAAPLTRAATLDFTRTPGDRPEGSFRVGGNTGCNHLGGTYTLEGARIAFFELVTTMIYCGDEVDRVERAFVGGLLHAETYEVRDGTLEIAGDGRTLIFEAVP